MIPGFFDPKRVGPAPKVRANVLLPELANRWFKVDFLLDTGAGITCLHPNDAINRAGLTSTVLSDPAQWRRREPARGVGGQATYFVVPAIYAFVTDAGQMQLVRGQTRVAQFRPGDMNLPSLLGWDILEKFEVVVDWRTRRVELR